MKPARENCRGSSGGDCTTALSPPGTRPVRAGDHEMDSCCYNRPGEMTDILDSLRWSKAEKKIARRAFDYAYRKECDALVQSVRERIAGMVRTGDLWDLHDFLTDKRRNMDRKYDYRHSKLIFVFPELIREGWLEESMLNGLDEDKIELIRKVAWFSD